MENGNTENGSMEERENGNGTPSGDVGSEVVLADKGEGETEVVTCMESEEGLELGMEICTYDSMGMGLEGDEEILTASSLEHVASCREGGGERTLETPPLSSPRDKLTLPNPREYLTLPGHRLHIDEQIYTEDSSTMEESSQVSQSDSLYCLSHASSMTSLTSDVGRTEEEDREEVGGANKELSDEGGGGGGRRRKGGKREVKKVKGRSFGQKAVDSRKLTSKCLGEPKVVLNRVQRKTTLQRRKVVQHTEGESSDSSEATVEENSRSSHSRNKGKRSSLQQPSQSARPPAPKRSKLPPDQPPKNLLGSILTDIPEIDIRPMAIRPMAILTRKTQPKKERDKPREKKESKKNEKPSNTTIQRDQPPKPSPSRPNPTSPPASAHQKILMSWERDYPLGLQATRAPVLYALDHIPDKLKAIKGGWMNKAKLIWTTWRRTSVAKRDEYCERAKQNRLRLKEKAAAPEKSSKKPTGTKGGKSRPKQTKTAPPTPPPPDEPSATKPADTADDESMATAAPSAAASRSDKTRNEPSSSGGVGLLEAGVKSRETIEEERGNGGEGCGEKGRTEGKEKEGEEQNGRTEGKGKEGREEGEKEKPSNGCQLPGAFSQPDPPPPAERERETEKTNPPSDHLPKSGESTSASTSEDSLTCSLNPTLSLPPSSPPSLHFYNSSLLSSPLSRSSSLGFPLAVSPLSPPFLPLPFPSLLSSGETTSHTPSTVTETQPTSSSPSLLPSTTETNKMADSNKPVGREAKSSIAETTSPNVVNFSEMGETAANPFIRDKINPFGTRHAVSLPQSTAELSRHSPSLSRSHAERRGERLRLDSQNQQYSHQTTPTSHQTPPTTSPSSALLSLSLTTSRPILNPSYLLSRSLPSVSSHSTSSSISAPQPRKQRSNSDSATYRNSSRKQKFAQPHRQSNSSGVNRSFPRRHRMSDSTVSGAPSLPRSSPLQVSSPSVVKKRQLSPELLSYLTPTSLSPVSPSLPSSVSLSTSYSFLPSILPLSSPPATHSRFTTRAKTLPPSLPHQATPTPTPSTSPSSSTSSVNPFPTRFGSKTIPHYAVAGDSSTSTTRSHPSNFLASPSNFSWASPQNFSWNNPGGFSSGGLTNQNRLAAVAQRHPSAGANDNRLAQKNRKNRFGGGDRARKSGNGRRSGDHRERRSQPTARATPSHTIKHLGGPLGSTSTSWTPSFQGVPSISGVPPAKYPRPNTLFTSPGGGKRRCASIGTSSRVPLPHCKPSSRPRSHSSSSFSLSKKGSLSPSSFSLPPSFTGEDLGQGGGSLIPLSLHSVIPQLPTELKRTGSGLTTPSDTPTTAGLFVLDGVATRCSSVSSTAAISAGLNSTFGAISSSPGTISGLSTLPGAISGLPSTLTALSGLSTTPGAISSLSTSLTFGLPPVPGSVSGLPVPSAISSSKTCTGSAISGLSTSTNSPISGFCAAPSLLARSCITTPGAVSSLYTSAVSGLYTSTSSAVSGLYTTTSSAVSGCTPGAISGKLPASKTSSTSKRKPATVSKTVSGKRGNSQKKPAAHSKKNSSTSGKAAANNKNRKNQFSNTRKTLPHPHSMFPMSPSTPHTPMSHSTGLESGHTTPSSLTPPIPTPPVLPGFLPPMTNPQTGQPGILLGQASPNGSLAHTLTYRDLERLYYQNLVLLEQQRQYTLFLEAELRKMERAEQQEDHGNQVVTEQQPSYEQFWECVTETDFDTTVSLSPCGSEERCNGDITTFIETSNGDIRLRPEHDYYGNLLNQYNSSHISS